MNVAAADFAASPAGYVVSVLVLILTALVAFGGRMVFSTQREHSNALTEIMKALAVLVNDHDHVTAAVTEAIADIDDLQSAVIVLQTWRALRDKAANGHGDPIGDYVVRRKTPVHRKTRTVG